MKHAGASLPVWQRLPPEKDPWWQGAGDPWASAETPPYASSKGQQSRSAEFVAPTSATKVPCTKVAIQVLSAVTGSPVVVDTLDSQWTIKRVKELIAKRQGSRAPVPCQRLVFQGCMVKDDNDCVEAFARHVGRGSLVEFQLIILPWSEALRAAAAVAWTPDHFFVIAAELYNPFEPYAACSDLAAAHVELAKACFNNADAQLAGCGFIVIEFAHMLDQTHRKLLIAEGKRDKDERLEQFTQDISEHLYPGFTVLGYLLLDLARDYLQGADGRAWQGMQEMVTESLNAIEKMATLFGPYQFVRLYRQLSSSRTLAQFCRTVEAFNF